MTPLQPTHYEHELDDLREQRDELLEALKAMVASYDGLRGTLTSRIVLAKLARADAAIATAERAK